MAWRELHRIQRDAAAIAELPQAQMMALTANLNRDSKRKPEPFSAADFCCYRERERAEDAFKPEVAAVALALKAENAHPPLLLTVWPQILASAKEVVATPETRAFKSDDGAVWVLAPVWEGQNCRGGLVLVQGRISGDVLMRDIDKPLLTHRFVLPERPGVGWIEAGHLLRTAES